MASRIALFPGSFDPLHNGHVEVIERAAALFDRVVVAVVRNPAKTPLFDLEERTAMISEALAGPENIEVDSFSTLVVECAQRVGATAIVKGLRAVTDFEYELQMAQMNRHLSGIDTIFIPTGSEHSFIASRLIREVQRLGGDVHEMVPAAVAKRLVEKFNNE